MGRSHQANISAKMPAVSAKMPAGGHWDDVLRRGSHKKGGLDIGFTLTQPWVKHAKKLRSAWAAEKKSDHGRAIPDRPDLETRPDRGGIRHECRMMSIDKMCR